MKKAGARKPTEAVTKRGQKATGLAKSKSSDRFSSTAKTKVKGATSGFAGSGTPLGTSMGVNPLNKSQIAGAVLAATGTGSIGKSIAKKAASKRAAKKMLDEFAKNTKKGIAQQSDYRSKDFLLPGNSGPRWNHD